MVLDPAMQDWRTVLGRNGVRSRDRLDYMGGIERGKRNPSLMVMARIAEALRAFDETSL
jgi:hypothetical protein